MDDTPYTSMLNAPQAIPKGKLTLTTRSKIVKGECNA